MDTPNYMKHEEFMKRMAKGPESDPINNPAHYNAGDIECIDAIESALGPEGFAAYCRGNAIKYLWRCEHKHQKPNEDWGKANWYINRIYQPQKKST